MTAISFLMEFEYFLGSQSRLQGRETLVQAAIRLRAGTQLWVCVVEPLAFHFSAHVSGLEQPHSPRETCHLGSHLFFLHDTCSYQ